MEEVNASTASEQPTLIPAATAAEKKQASVAAHRARMLELAEALNARLDERAKAGYFSDREYGKRKAKAKLAKKHRARNRR